MAYEEKKIVNGIDGLAAFILEHLDHIKNGAFVAFAGQEPENTNETDLDYWYYNSEGWYGVELCENYKHFDHEDEDTRTALYIDYFVDHAMPELVIVDNDFEEENKKSLERAISEITWRMGDKFEKTFVRITA